ncbi:MAG: hypothetical protein D6689_02565 [Deltaproteobacteria bacterium]|nr:MAG: hypothetical protein D6689_02565 [Deltaproteobacteria bacterium]
MTACWLDEPRPVGYDRHREVLGPVAMKDRVAYVDTARDRVIFVDSAGGDPVVRTVGIGRSAVFVTPTPDRSRLVVITRGEEAVVEGQVDEEPALWVVDPDGGEAPVAYPIGSPFNRIAISSDGAEAVAYYTGSGFDPNTGVFRNPNEVAVVHLSQPPGDGNPVVRTVRSFGAAPDGVVLSPPMAIPGADDSTPRTFAFILAPNTVTILDATHPERDEVSIRLDQGSDVTVYPREIAFAPDRATAYLRADNARDIVAIEIHPDPPSAERPRDNDYRPVLAELGTGGGPADVAWYDDAAGRRFVVAATPGTRDVVVIDANTAEFVTVETPDPIDRILLFPAGGDQPPRTAVLASLGDRSSRVHLLALDGITDPLVPIDLRTVDLAAPVVDVVPVPGRAYAMIVHDADRTVLGLLDVAFGSVSPLQGAGRLDAYDFSAGGTHLVGITSGVARVGFVELDTLHPFDLRLDDAPGRVFALAGGGVYVDHSDPFGRATILPSVEAGRQESVVLSGFLLADWIDEPL